MRFKANDQTWTIRKVDCEGFPRPDHFGNGWCAWAGWTEPETKTIYILKYQALDQERITVLHELMHVAVGVDRSNENTNIHQAIYDISDALEPILLDNAELVNYLGGK